MATLLPSLSSDEENEVKSNNQEDDDDDEESEDDVDDEFEFGGILVCDSHSLSCIARGSIHSWLSYSIINREKMEDLLGKDLPKDGIISLHWISWKRTIQNFPLRFRELMLLPLLLRNERT
jgi:hypothetical protein